MVQRNYGQVMREMEAKGAWFPGRHPETSCRRKAVGLGYVRLAWSIAPSMVTLLDLAPVHPEDREELCRVLGRQDLWDHICEHGLVDRQGHPC